MKKPLEWGLLLIPRNLETGKRLYAEKLKQRSRGFFLDGVSEFVHYIVPGISHSQLLHCRCIDVSIALVCSGSYFCFRYFSPESF